MEFPTTPTLHPLPPGAALIGPGLTGTTVDVEAIDNDHLLCMVTCGVGKTTFDAKGVMTLTLMVHGHDKFAALPMTDIIGRIVYVGFWSTQTIREMYTPATAEPDVRGQIGPGNDGPTDDAVDGDEGVRRSAPPRSKVAQAQANIRARKAEERFIRELRAMVEDD